MEEGIRGREGWEKGGGGGYRRGREGEGIGEGGREREGGEREKGKMREKEGERERERERGGGQKRLTVSLTRFSTMIISFICDFKILNKGLKVSIYLHFFC